MAGLITVARAPRNFGVIWETYLAKLTEDSLWNKEDNERNKGPLRIMSSLLVHVDMTCCTLSRMASSCCLWLHLVAWAHAWP